MPSGIKIVVLIDRYLPILGGAQNNVHELCRRLSSKGMKINVLTRRVYRGMGTREVLDNVLITRLGYFPVRIISKIFCFFRIVWHLVRHRDQYDAILCVPSVELTGLLPAYVVSWIVNKPYIIRMTGLPAFDAPPQKDISSVLSNVMQILIPNSFWLQSFYRASAIIAQSQVLQGMVEKYKMSHCEVIPNGIDTKRFNIQRKVKREEFRQRFGLPQKKIVLINTGRYDKEKNQITLLKAAEHIEKKLRSGKIHVLIVGATQRNQITSNETQLKDYVANKKLGWFIQFIDNTDSVEDYLVASDIFVHPTENEGMSNALLEAMACGLPIVCSNIPQETCIFPNGKGYFFPPKDYNLLSEHLINLIDSRELRESYGSQLANFAQDKYSNDHLAEKYAQLFRRVVHPESA